MIARLDAAPRRGLRRDDASRYVGVSPSKFSEMVLDGRMPRPFSIDRCAVWDIRKLDLAFDALQPDTAPHEADDGWGDFDVEHRA